MPSLPVHAIAQSSGQWRAGESCGTTRLKGLDSKARSRYPRPWRTNGLFCMPGPVLDVSRGESWMRRLLVFTRWRWCAGGGVDGTEACNRGAYVAGQVSSVHSKAVGGSTGSDRLQAGACVRNSAFRRCSWLRGPLAFGTPSAKAPGARGGSASLRAASPSLIFRRVCVVCACARVSCVSG
jgi:hypothetical protein